MTEEQIVNSYKNAINPIKQVKILAELNATTKNEILRILKRNDVTIHKPKPKKYPKPSEEMIATLRKMYGEGATYAKMGEALNRSGGYIHKLIKQLIDKGEMDACDRKTKKAKKYNIGNMQENV
jgi:hypothetical protein